MARYLYSELAAAIQARLNCSQQKAAPNPLPEGYIAKAEMVNPEWFDKWTERIHDLEQLLPSGSGIDCGTKVDLDASHAEKLVLYTSFHHMNDGGMYDGWTEHIIVVTPSFRGINLRISGRNRNDIKEYLYDTYNYALKQDVDDKPMRGCASVQCLPEVWREFHHSQ